MLDRLAKRVHDDVYRGFYSYKTTVFLCGAGANAPNSIRQDIDIGLTRGQYGYRYDMFYPEDLFAELLYGPQHQDLLSLENVLAQGVDAVLLVVESIGAVAELGAFASSPELRKKLVCVIDKQYRRKRSFINYGPIRLLQDKKEGGIVYGDFKDVPALLKPIRDAIGKVKRKTSKETNVRNVVQAHQFVLPCIYLLEPVPRETIVQLVRFASGTDEKTAVALSTGALAILSKRREIRRTADGYLLTAQGEEHFAELGRKGRTRQTYHVSNLDSLRVAVLNWQYRGKRLEV